MRAKQVIAGVKGRWGSADGKKILDAITFNVKEEIQKREFLRNQELELMTPAISEKLEKGKAQDQD